ncbi:MAG: GNAT family N-acetyltransferase [Gaiellaceae bacterium]
MAEIRAMTRDDWPAVEAIYADGIATGDATFETEPPSWEEPRERDLPRRKIEHRQLSIALEDDPPQESSQRRNTTHALWPPKPNEFETPISISVGRASFGT